MTRRLPYLPVCSVGQLAPPPCPVGESERHKPDDARRHTLAAADGGRPLAVSKAEPISQVMTTSLLDLGWRLTSSAAWIESAVTTYSSSMPGAVCLAVIRIEDVMDAMGVSLLHE